MKMMDKELQTLSHKQDHSRDSTIQLGVQNSGNCPSLPWTFSPLLCICIFCSFIFIPLPYSFYSPWFLGKTFPPSNIKSRMTSSVKPFLTLLEDLRIHFSKFELIPIIITVLNHWFFILVTYWNHLGCFKCSDAFTAPSETHI